MRNERKFVGKKQGGLVLLVLSILIALTISAYYFNSISLFEINLEKDEKTRHALVEAKQALLAYAVTNWRTVNNMGLMGRLPCPDTAVPEGEQNAPCGNAYANGIGFFPWRTLGLDTLRSSDGECLLYAVSPAYKPAPVAALNPDSYGQFEIVDQAGAVVLGDDGPGERPVAVIFAAGKALDGQARTHAANSRCGLDYANIAAYLDDDGVTDNTAINTGVDNIIDQFVSRYPDSEEGDDPLNDQLIAITHDEFWQALDATITDAAFNTKMRQVTEAIAVCFAEYAQRPPANYHLPMPAPLNVGGGEYRRNVDYDDSGNFTTAFAGRLPYTVANANAELANGAAANIFDNPFCNGLTLNVAGLNGINLADDAGTDNGEFFDLWQNWKDHFFYAVSAEFKPDGGGSACTGANCVEVNGTERAAIIFFAGAKEQAGQVRFGPPFDAAEAADGIDDKDEVDNYIEGTNAANFTDNTGNADYDPVDPLNSNDIMFCIQQDMSVVECL